MTTTETTTTPPVLGPAAEWTKKDHEDMYMAANIIAGCVAHDATPPPWYLDDYRRLDAKRGYWISVHLGVYR